MNILITGGAGYIGSILVGRLLNEGHDVTVYDNLHYGQTSLFQYCNDSNFSFVKADVRNDEKLKEHVTGKDVIIPLAAIVGAPSCERNPDAAKAINLEAIKTINATRSDSQKIIFPTTNSGYGRTSGETYCTEETPLEPISLYGRTKVEAEERLLDSPNTITLRLATVFGTSPRMRTDLMVNNFTYEAVTRGYIIVYEKDFKRDFIHVRDVADCIVHCLGHFEEMKNEPYNVGLDEANLSKQELAEAIQEHVDDFHIEYSEIGSDPDKRNYIVSNEKLNEAGFRAKRSIHEGIEELIEGYKMMPLGQFRNY